MNILNKEEKCIFQGAVCKKTADKRASILQKRAGGRHSPGSSKLLSHFNLHLCQPVPDHKKVQLEESMSQVNPPLGSLDASTQFWGRRKFSCIYTSTMTLGLKVREVQLADTGYNHVDSSEEFEEAFTRGNTTFVQLSVPVGCLHIETWF